MDQFLLIQIFWILFYRIFSGKTSLLSAILGEINKISGEVFCNGSVAYVSQEAWIQSGTLQENILFGKNLNEIYYDEVIKACSLDEDLKILPKGSQTEIGQKGVNLSGGQKQRIALARAIYSNSDIYIFDDPLSAVDSHVKNQLFERIMSNQGILKTKTRVLVSNDFSILNQVEQIVMLKDGELIKDIVK
jgi:ABC-type multidrug transport system fused ATPase/permease subunit